MPAYLKHTGVLGMKWGVRRYQNEDGTLTALGKRHYAETGETGYHYKSLLTKHHEKYAERRRQQADEAEAAGDTKRAEKLRSKAERNEKKAEYNREIDSRMQHYSSTVKTGGNIAARILTLGAVGGKKYQTMMAVTKGHDRSNVGKKAVSALFGAVSITAFPVADLIARGVGYQVETKAYKDTARRIGNAGQRAWNKVNGWE
jgi:hypothetical protein